MSRTYLRVGVFFLLFNISGFHASADSRGEFSTKSFVGRIGTNVYYTPANQILTPVGLQVELPGMRPQAIALSPNGRILVTSGKTPNLIVLDPRTGKIMQTVPLPSEKDKDPAPEPVSQEILEPDKTGQVSFTGLIFSPDGSRIYLANVNGSIKVFGVQKDDKVVGLFSISLPRFSETKRSAEIPSGLALSSDGKHLYVAFNLSNRLGEFDTVDGRLLRTWEVGVAPFDVALVGKKIYVSNWGGRRPDAKSLTGPAGQGVRVRVDPVRHIANEGSVTVISLAEATGSKPTEIVAGMHASALATSPNGRYVVVANTGSDTLSVIDTQTDKIVETIWARQDPGDLFGAQPDALAFDKSGKKLFVCNGTQNAVAVFNFSPGESKLLGLIPVGWFPGAIVHDSRRDTLCVANTKGIGSTKKLAPGDPVKFNSHQYFGTLSFVKTPSKGDLAKLTEVARYNMRYGLLQDAKLPARSGQPARPVPERIGEPSVFKHVIYIIKENRTYDQVLGDIKEGNGDPSLCIFGEKFTPNQHKLSREFVLLDNTYCSGICSADGHQWTDSAIVNDYIEKSFAGFPRSYPYYGDDAMAYASSGFIWDNVIAHDKTLRNYGEFTFTDVAWKDGRKGNPKFLDYYSDFVNQTGLISISCRPTVESLRGYVVTNTAGWNLSIPDVYRAACFIRDLKEFERTGGFPNFTIIFLPNDHTSGTRANGPTPAAMVADNDLAFGQIVDAVSHSKFWKETCIFAIEDDPQAGWDHVSGFRTTAYVVSPYTKRKAVVSTQYNQTSLVRTMELILGLPPMNQLDATATPMSDCFTDVADFTPYTVVTNNIPLNELNPEAKRASNTLLRKHILISNRLPFEKVDACPEDTLNRILWHAMKGPDEAYPDWAVKADLDDDE